MSRKTLRVYNILELTKESIFSAFDSCLVYNCEYSDNKKDNCTIWDYVVDSCLYLCGKGADNGFKMIEASSDWADYNVVLVNVNSVDYSDIKYLISMLYNIEYKCGNYKVCCYQACVKNRKGNPDMGNYFRLSAFLNLWILQSGNIDNIKFLDTESVLSAEKEKNANPKRLAMSSHAESFSMSSAKFFPMLEINSPVYFALNEKYNGKKSELEERKKRSRSTLNALRHLIDQKAGAIDISDAVNIHVKAYISDYIDMYISLINDEIKKTSKKKITNSAHKELLDRILHEINEMPLLTAALFIVACSNDIDSDVNVSLIAENCYAYAQGILQLIENAYLHVVKRGQEYNNKAVLCFILKKAENFRYINKVGLNSSVENFFEFSVTDCDFMPSDRGEKGIVAQFNRQAKLSKQIESLQEIFEEAESQALSEFYGKQSNIALHYGLQIFNTVVSANGGLFAVKSGFADSELYINKLNVDSSGIAYDYDILNKLYKNHFAGTDYTIILPVRDTSNDDEYNFFMGNMPIDKADYHVSIAYYKLKQIEPYSGDLTNNIATIFVNSYKRNISAIAESADNIGSNVMCCDITDFTYAKQVEYFCKGAALFMTAPKKDGSKNPYNTVCIEVGNKSLLLIALRTVATLFNKLGNCAFLSDKGILLYCADGGERYELYFCGSRIESVLVNIAQQRIIKALPDSFYREVCFALSRGHKLSKQAAASAVMQGSDFVPLSVLEYELKIDEKSRLSVEGKDSLLQTQLAEILKSDIHKPELGCYIHDTHVRIGSVHLDTFYEAQFLFGSAYWKDIFAYYIYQKTIAVSQGYDKIVLYGYETYSSRVLEKCAEWLGQYKCEKIIYEKKHGNNCFIRYLSNNTFSNREKSMPPKVLLVYVIGISSTLSTFDQMHQALISSDKYFYSGESLCLSIIQVVGKENDDSQKFIEQVDAPLGKAFSSKKQYVDFARDGAAYCFVTADATWYDSVTCDCKLCLPDRYQDERPLIEVDETSVVPMQLIELEQSGIRHMDSEDRAAQDRAAAFLENDNNSEYLLHDHIVRHDNHFQYYFRIFKIYNDKKEDIKKWLRGIKLPKSNGDKHTINVIIAPQHYGNVGFVDSVNECVFNGKAHIIELDVRKEYRSNFKAKYSNYNALMENSDRSEKYELNFYYVNDQIISGETFKRAATLVQSLFRWDIGSDKIFRGVFVMIDRNSVSTRRSYVSDIEEETPFYAYLRFAIPSLRSYDDSCPICSQAQKSKEIASVSAFGKSALFWQEKAICHREKQMITDDNNVELSGKNAIRHFRRLKCENDLWSHMLAQQIKDGEDPREAIRQCIESTIIDGISFNLNCDDSSSSDKSLPLIVKRYLQNEHVPKSLKYDLFKIVIVSLCNMGSCVLLEKNRLLRCLHIGKYLSVGCDEVMEKSDGVKSMELLISYIKVMTRPLLWYRETVKFAALRILLDILNELTAMQFPDQIDAFAKKGSKAFVELNVFMLNAIKRLLCYDKGVSKALYCDKRVFVDVDGTTEVDDDDFLDFFTQLYVENNRCEIIRKIENNSEHQSILEKRGDGFVFKDINKYDDISEKYKEIIKLLQLELAEDIPMAFFIVSEKSIFPVVSDSRISDIDSVPENYSHSAGIYYITIDNNYNQLIDATIESGIAKDCEAAISAVKSELGLMQDVCIVMAIKTNDKIALRKILAYRQQILDEVQKDFTSGLLSKFITNSQLIRALASGKSATHSKTPFSDYCNLFESTDAILAKLRNKDGELVERTRKAQAEIISAYMSMLISMFFVELINRFTDKAKPGRDGTITFDKEFIDNIPASDKWTKENDRYSDIPRCVRYAFDMFVYKYNNDQEYGEQYGELRIEFDDDKFLVKRYNIDAKVIDQKIKEFFSGYITTIHFGDHGVGYFEPFMIIDAIVQNAFTHYGTDIVLKFIKHNDVIDISLENKYTEDREDASSYGTTLLALKNIFGTKKTNDITSTYLQAKDELEQSKYTVTINNYFYKE